MKEIKRILYPTDFSAMATMGYKYCLNIAKEFGARVDVLHVYRLDLGVPVPENIAHNLIEERRKNAHLHLSAFAHLHKAADSSILEGVDIHAHAAVGLAEDEISAFSEANDIDLIIMPTKGEHNLLETIFGSVTTATIAKSKCPVLIVPENAEYAGIKKIAYATDLSSDNIDHVSDPIKLARVFKASLDYVHIYSDAGNEATQDQINEILAANTKGVDVTFFDMKGATIEEGMQNYLKKNKVDLLMTYSPPKTFFERLFRMSKTRHFVEHLSKPLLVFR